jgi:murein hydrolase activator
MTVVQGFKFNWVRVLLLCISGCWGIAGWSQDKATLQNQRDALETQIATTERLLADASANRNDAVGALRLLDERVSLREKLIRHHQSEIRQLERSMSSTDSEIRALEGHIAAMKNEYARMIESAYRISLAQNPWLYLFSASDFAQAALRFRLMQSYSTLRKEQVQQIEEAQSELTRNHATLENESNALRTALDDIESERDRLKKDRNTRASLVTTLKGEERRLRKQVKKAQAERERLNQAIRNIIEAELKAERASSAGEFALTPEGKIVSAAFESNKASLSWPVLRGVVTGKFGRQAHPTLPGITIDNNGIDITTEKGSTVLSVFDGTISSIFPIPGAGETLIISHGAFRTVYSNLTDIQVAKGQKIGAGERLGAVRTTANRSMLHFEVWQIKGTSQTPQNPASWLVKN